MVARTVHTHAHMVVFVSAFQEGRVVLAALLPLGRQEEDVVKNGEEEDILKDMPRPQMTYPEP
jgi:hypothetical protein